MHNGILVNVNICNRFGILNVSGNPFIDFPKLNVVEDLKMAEDSPDNTVSFVRFADIFQAESVLRETCLWRHRVGYLGRGLVLIEVDVGIVDVIEPVQVTNVISHVTAESDASKHD